MAGWTDLKGLLQEEIQQRKEEGCNVTGFKERLDAAAQNPRQLNALYDELMALEGDKALDAKEPSDLAGIRALRPASAKERIGFAKAPIDKDLFRGAWIGRSCGCALGKPVEAGDFMDGHGDMPGWKCVYEWFNRADAYPIKNYTPSHSRAAEELGLSLTPWSQGSLRENIKFMESDDDIRYMVIALIMMERYGLDWEPLTVGSLWHQKLPYGDVCTAEKQAYLNYAMRPDMLPHNPTDAQKDEFLDWVRTYRNPYREWIGAQIRIDCYAYAAAGNPELAAELAWRDSAFSHVKNGIYGAMFISAMIAAAFVEKDNYKIVEAALAQIPADCRLAEAVRQAVLIAENAKDELDLVEKIWNAFGHYHCVHAINNTALCVASIIFAGDDYEKAITTSVLGGWDTDCNGATVGSIMGAKLGTASIPAYWSEPLHDTLYSSIPDFHPIPISTCADRCYDLYVKYRA